MKKILLSLSMVAAIAVVVVGATGAFFSDTETSTGNIFTAGAIDLKIDNTSYYNGLFNDETSWQLDDLGDHLFFNFLDVKPGDEGEDTISIHVDNNDAWVCVDINITANDDNGLTEPESEVDATDGDGEGELADALNFIFWADDGDNVLEEDEGVLTQGPASAVLNGVTWAIADSNGSVFADVDLTEGGALVGGETYYIGKAWCFGDLTENPVPADQGQDPTVDSGVLCNGENAGNETQTDSLEGDITFYAEQARHNAEFVCGRTDQTPT